MKRIRNERREETLIERDTRNTLIRRLRSRGWSLRRIAAHEQVGLSQEGVRKVLASGPPVETPDDVDVITLASPDPATNEPPVGPVEFVGVDESRSYALFVDSHGAMTDLLALYRLGGFSSGARSRLRGERSTAVRSPARRTTLH